MSRQSSRKVKLTSKFEEFTSSRLSTGRLAHNEQHNTTLNNDANLSIETTPIIKPERVAKSEKEIIKSNEQPPSKVTNIETPISTRERQATKALKQKVLSTPATPVPTYQTPSSTPTPYSQITPLPKLTANGKVRGRPRKHMIQKAETVVKPISSTREELFRLREENINLRSQLEQKTAEFEELKRQSSYTGQTVPKVDYDDLKEKYQRDMVHAKRREWCYLCLSPSRYYCCWNTTYCSPKCQVTDWYQRHMKSCERRKKMKTAA